MDQEMFAVAEESLDTLWAQAQADEHAGDHCAARNGYADILARLLDQGVSPPFHLVDRLADACTTLGEFQPAARLLLAARERMESLGDDCGVYHVTLKLARLWLAAADLDGAEVFLDEAQLRHGCDPEQEQRALDQARAVTWPGRSPLDIALLRAGGCLTLARYWTARGRFEAAIRATSLALEIAPGASPFLSTAAIGMSLAQLHLDCGDLTAAREVEDRIRKMNGEFDEADEARWHLLAAHRERMAGRLSHARRILEALLDVPAGTPLRKIDLQAAWALGDLFARLNRINAAENVLAAVEARLKDDPAGDAWRCDFQRLRALLERKRAGTVQETVLPFVPQQVGEEELDPFDDEPDLPRDAAGAADDRDSEIRIKERFADEWALRFNSVLRALDADRLDAAAIGAQALATLVGATDSPRMAARIRYLMGLIAYYGGDYAAAREAALESLASARKQNLKLDELESLGVDAWTAARLGLHEDYERACREQKALLDELLASLQTEDRAHRRRNLLSKQDEYLSVRIASIAAIPPPRIPVAPIAGWLHRSAIRRAVVQRCREMTCLVGFGQDRSLAPAGDPADAKRPVPPDQATTGEQVEAWVDMHLALTRRGSPDATTSLLDAWWPLRRIPRNHAILHYYAVADRLFAFVLARGFAAVHTLPVTRIALYEGVHEALDAIAEQYQQLRNDRRVTEALRSLSAQLGLDSVLAPLGSRIDRLWIVPHDVLVHAPFAALPTGTQHLCERFVLSLLPNLRGFLPSSAAHWAPPQSFLGVAVQQYPGTDLHSLRHAVAEVEQVKAVCPAPKQSVLDDALASPDAVVHALGGVEWAHFACHGIFDLDAPHRSRLMVGPVDGTAAAITLADLHSHDLRRLRLVVLAACWTSSAAVLPGGELVSLPAAFLRAGARGVLAPLWAVDDAASIKLMVEFYRKASKMSPAHALAEVQRSRLHDGSMAYEWAGYVHHGNG